MKKEILEQHINNFLEKQEIHFSEDWKKKILSQLVNHKSEAPEKKIRFIHESLLEKLFNDGVRYVLAKYRDYGEDWAKDVVATAREEKWLKYYDGSKGPELPFLKKSIDFILPHVLDKENPLIREEDELDETGQVIYLKNGKPKKKQIRIVKIRDAFREPVNDEKRDEEQDHSSNDGDPQEENPYHGILTYNLSDEDQNRPGYDKLSREHKLMLAHQYDKIRKKQKPDSKTSAESAHHITASEILLRHYILKGVVSVHSTRSMPAMDPYDFHADAGLRHMDGNFYKARWRVLKDKATEI